MKIVRIELAEIKGSVYQPRSQPDLELENLVQSLDVTRVIEAGRNQSRIFTF
ncbi:MAG: hypothetical protein Q7J27_01315 [Syntrophales bacterium]|nr:hypothetical protein [Syntrophales bacterium]